MKFSRRGKPTDNAFVESFNGKVRDEFLNVYCFKSIMEMKYKARNWIDEYNNEGPHSSLGMLTPREFIDKTNRNNAAELTA